MKRASFAGFPYYILIMGFMLNSCAPGSNVIPADTAGTSTAQVDQNTPTPTLEVWPSLAISPTSAGQVEQVRIWGTGTPLRIDNNSKNILLIQTVTGAYLYDIKKDKLLFSDPLSLNSAISSNDKTLATIHKTGELISMIIWDIASGKQLFNNDLSIPSSEYSAYDAYYGSIPVVGAVAFSSNGKWVAAGFANGQIGVWNMNTQKMASLFYAERGYRAAPVTQLYFSPNNKYLYVEALVNSLYEITENSVNYIGQASGVFSPNSDFTSRVGCGHLYVYRTEDAKLIVDKPVRNDPEGERCRKMVGLGFNKDSSQIIIEYPELNERQVRNANDGELIRKEDFTPAEIQPGSEWFLKQNHLQNLIGANILPNRTVLAWGATGREVYWWKSSDNSIVIYPQELAQVYFSSNGDKAAWCNNAQLIILQNNGLQTSTPTPDFPLCDGVLLSPDNDTVAIWANKRIAPLSLSTGEIQNLQDHPSKISKVIFSEDGLLMASATEGASKILIWQINPIKKLGEINDRSDILDLEFSSDNTVLAAHGYYNRKSNQVQFWEISNGNSIGKIDLDYYDKTTTINESSQLIASGREDGTVTIWDISSGKKLVELGGHFGYYGVYDFGSPLSIGLNANRYIYDGTYDYANANGDRYLYNRYNIRSLSFLQENTGILSVATDGTIRLWGIKP